MPDSIDIKRPPGGRQPRQSNAGQPFFCGICSVGHHPDGHLVLIIQSDHLVLSDQTKVIIWSWVILQKWSSGSEHLMIIHMTKVTIWFWLSKVISAQIDSIVRHFLFWLGYLFEEVARSLTLILLTRFSRLGLISDGPRPWQQRWDDACMKLAC